MKKYFLILAVCFSLVLVGCVNKVETLADVLNLASKNTNYHYRQVDPTIPDEYTEIFFKDGKLKIQSPVGDTYVDTAENKLYAGSNQDIFKGVFIFSEIPAQLEGFLKYNLVIPINKVDTSIKYLKQESLGDKEAYVFELVDNESGYDYTTTVWLWNKNGLPIKFKITNNATGNSIDINVEDIELGVVTDQDVSLPTDAQLIDSSQIAPEDLTNVDQ